MSRREMITEAGAAEMGDFRPDAKKMVYGKTMSKNAVGENRDLLLYVKIANF